MFMLFPIWHVNSPLTDLFLHWYIFHFFTFCKYFLFLHLMHILPINYKHFVWNGSIKLFSVVFYLRQYFVNFRYLCCVHVLPFDLFTFSFECVFVIKYKYIHFCFHFSHLYILLYVFHIMFIFSSWFDLFDIHTPFLQLFSLPLFLILPPVDSECELQLFCKPFHVFKSSLTRILFITLNSDVHYTNSILFKCVSQWSPPPS